MVCLDRQRDSPLGDILVITILSGDSSMTYKQRMLPVVRKVSCYAAPYGSVSVRNLIPTYFYYLL